MNKASGYKLESEEDNKGKVTETYERHKVEKEEKTRKKGRRNRRSKEISAEERN
jgi:hypothetical protein